MDGITKPIGLTTDTLVELANRLKAEKPHCVLVFNPADWKPIEEQCIVMREKYPIGGHIFPADTFFGLKLFQHSYLGRGEMIPLDSDERGARFLRALDRLQKERKPWQLAILEVMETQSS